MTYSFICKFVHPLDATFKLGSVIVECAMTLAGLLLDSLD